MQLLTSLKIMAKNELEERFPTNQTSKDCLAGIIESNRLESNWLGFSTVYQTVVSHTNTVSVEIKPQHGQPDHSTVPLQATVKKTSVKWESTGRSTRIEFGPHVSRCSRCNKQARYGYASNQPNSNSTAAPTHCRDHKLEGQVSLYRC